VLLAHLIARHYLLAALRERPPNPPRPDLAPAAATRIAALRGSEEHLE